MPNESVCMTNGTIGTDKTLFTIPGLKTWLTLLKFPLERIMVYEIRNSIFMDTAICRFIPKKNISLIPYVESQTFLQKSFSFKETSPNPIILPPQGSRQEIKGRKVQSFQNFNS